MNDTRENQREADIESLPLRYKLLFDGDNRGWRTGIDCVLELSKMDIWKKHTINEDDIAILEQAKIDGRPKTPGGNLIDYQWIIDDFIDSARAVYENIEWSLEWIDGSIFAVPVEMNAHEIKCLFGEE